MNQISNEKSYLIGLATYTTWGIFPIFFKNLNAISPIEIVINRIIWSAIFAFIFLCYSKIEYKYIFKNPKYISYLLITGLLISCNWMVYVLAVNTNKIIETSLGYYLNPIVIIFLGMFFFNEKLRLLQIVSISIALLGILIQVFYIGYFPWISIIIAFSFAFYALIRKIIQIPALLGITFETILILPIYLFLLFYLPNLHNFQFLIQNNYILLILFSLISIITMLTFNITAKKLPFISLGFMQFIPPTISLFIAIFIYHENFSKYYLITFILIFIALIIYCIDIYNNWKLNKKI